MKRAYLILWCFAVAVSAYVLLDYWDARNAPLYKRFERQWREDIELLESSGKLPAPWAEVGEIEIYGGTPETKKWLRRIEVPVREKKQAGRYRLEVLVVAWEEEGKYGALTQYNLIDRKTKNMIWELGRTLILAEKPGSLAPSEDSAPPATPTPEPAAKK